MYRRLWGLEPDPRGVNQRFLKHLEDQLWKSADELRANSDLASNEYDTPVLGVIFLKFNDGQFKSGRRERLAFEHTVQEITPDRLQHAAP